MTRGDAKVLALRDRMDTFWVRAGADFRKDFYLAHLYAVDHVLLSNNETNKMTLIHNKFELTCFKNEKLKSDQGRRHLSFQRTWSSGHPRNEHGCLDIEDLDLK